MNRPLSADRTWVRTVALTLLTALLTGAPALAQRRAITEKDLFDFVWVADPHVSRAPLTYYRGSYQHL